MQSRERLRENELYNLTRPGRHSDGCGLYLLIDKAGCRRWVFLYRRHGKRHEAGLGGLDRVTLREARRKAAAAGGRLAKGLDPFPGRLLGRRIPTFGEVAEKHLSEAIGPSVTAKHEAQWRMTLFKYARAICDLRVDEVYTSDVLAVLEPHWAERHITAKRLRARIAAVLDVAKAKGYRTGDNPAAWNGNLEYLLQVQPDSGKCHASLPWQEIPRFMARVLWRFEVCSVCLAVAVLTGATTREVIAAERREFDLEGLLWVVPAHRSCSGVIRHVPLPYVAARILRDLWSESAGRYVFEDPNTGAPIPQNAPLNLLRTLDPTATVHGFRDSLRDWAFEATDFPGELVGLVLGKAAVRTSSRSGEAHFAMTRRREVIDAWSAYCSSAIWVPTEMRSAGREKSSAHVPVVTLPCVTGEP